MSIQEISTWLGSSPILQGEKLNFSYLPSYSGWSLTIPKTETRADILGNRRELWQLKITRRCTIQSNEERFAVVEALEDLAAWAEAHPPELESGLTGERPQAPRRRASVRRTALSESQFTGRNNSGIEDISIIMNVESVE